MLMQVWLRRRSPAQTVGERRGSGGVTLPVERRAVSSRAQWPEGGGRARQVQADVPERVYGGGDAAGEGGGRQKTLYSFHSGRTVVTTGRRWQERGDFGTSPSLWRSWRLSSLDWEVKIMPFRGGVQQLSEPASSVCVSVTSGHLDGFSLN